MSGAEEVHVNTMTEQAQMDTQDKQIGKRRRIKIDGQNYYMFVSHTTIDITMPEENRDDNLDQREILDQLCLHASALLKEIHDGEKEEEPRAAISSTE